MAFKMKGAPSPKKASAYKRYGKEKEYKVFNMGNEPTPMLKMENNRDIAVDKNRAEFLKSLNITQADVNKYAESKGIDMAEVPSREEYMKIARKEAKARTQLQGSSVSGQPLTGKVPLFADDVNISGVSGTAKPASRQKGGVRANKKGGKVYRRGGGQALRGFGKATYSKKKY